MPYSRAPYYMLGVIGILILGFWPSYFAVAPTVPWQFHAHGVAASLWVLTVTAQSWTANRKKQLPLHRAVGKASLFLFPFLTGGLAAIISRQGQDFVAGDPVNLLYGPGFMIGTMVAIVAYVTVYYLALRYRRKVWVHAGYMLSTPLILFESPFSRVMGLYIPRFQVHGPADFACRNRPLSRLRWIISSTGSPGKTGLKDWSSTPGLSGPRTTCTRLNVSIPSTRALILRRSSSFANSRVRTASRSAGRPHRWSSQETKPRHMSRTSRAPTCDDCSCLSLTTTFPNGSRSPFENFTIPWI